MPDNKLLGYIKKYLAKNFSESEIRKKLAKSGYKKEKIDQAFHSIPTPAPAPKPEKKVKLPVHWEWYLIGVLVIVAIIIIVMVIPKKPALPVAPVPAEEVSPGLIDQIYEQAVYTFYEFSTDYTAIALAVDSVIDERNHCELITDPVSNPDCETSREEYASLQNAATGRCDEIAVFTESIPSLDSPFCSALLNNCEELTGERREVCLGILQRGSNVCTQFFSGIDTCDELLSVYNAIRTQDASWCNNIKNIINKEACISLALRKNNLFEGIIKDLSILQVVKRADATNLCTDMRSNALEQRCKDRTKSYDEILLELQDIVFIG